MYGDRDQRMLKSLERAAGLQFLPTSAPGPEQVMKASAGMAAEQLARVPVSLLPYFMDTAKEIITVRIVSESQNPTVATKLPVCCCDDASVLLR